MGSGPARSYLRFGLSSVVVVELAEPPATMKAVPKSTPVGFVFSFFLLVLGGIRSLTWHMALPAVPRFENPNAHDSCDG